MLRSEDKDPYGYTASVLQALCCSRANYSNICSESFGEVFLSQEQAWENSSRLFEHVYVANINSGVASFSLKQTLDTSSEVFFSLLCQRCK